MSDGKKAIKRDLDAETFAKYRALEERCLAERRQVRLVIRRAYHQVFRECPSRVLSWACGSYSPEKTKECKAMT